jgi:hypothetical protein
MARKRYTAEEIIRHLRTIEIEMGKSWPSSRPVARWASRSRRTR